MIENVLIAVETPENSLNSISDSEYEDAEDAENNYAGDFREQALMNINEESVLEKKGHTY
jgi:hypothetical protein